VLVAGGAITAIEVDYSSCRAEPSSTAMEALFRAMVESMAEPAGAMPVPGCRAGCTRPAFATWMTASARFGGRARTWPAREPTPPM
jgi:hypothetical protein